MARFKIRELDPSPVLLVETERFGDDRGFFMEAFRAEVFEAQGVPAFVQDNHSRSSQGVLRGLHYQLQPRALGKLVRCIQGKILDVAVDLRRGSPTFGRWVGQELSEDQPTMLYVPPGFAHGFCTLSEVADVLYKCTDYYSPEHDRNVRWNDPQIGIEWPIEQPTLSEKDAAAPLLKDADNNFDY